MAFGAIEPSLLGALGAIGASVIRSPNLQESLDEALQTILAVLRLDGGLVFLQSEDGRLPTLAAHRSMGPALVALAGNGLLPGIPAGQALFESGELRVVTDVTQEPDLPIALLQQLQIGAFVAVPLRGARGTLGLLMVHARTPRPFQPEEIALISAAGEQLGMGIQGLQLLAAEKRRAGELAVLNQLAVAVGQSLDLHTIVDQALDCLLGQFRAGAGLAYLLDERANPTLVAHRGLGEEIVRCWQAHPPIGWTPGQGFDAQTRWGADLSAACPRPDLLAAEGLVSYLGAPLRAQHRIEGSLIILTREPCTFLPNEIELFQALAHEVGLAVENAQLYAEAQRRLAEVEALQQFNQRILHAMQEGIFIIGTSGQITYATPRLTGLTGYTEEELLGQDWSVLARPEDRPALLADRKLLLAGHSTRHDLSLVRKDGRLLQVSVGLVPLFDGAKLTGLLGVVTDLTEEIQLRRRLQQAEKLSAVGKLVAGVAHELNNPLTVIRGYAQLLLGREETGGADRELAAISEHAERAAHIVQELLTFAREHPPARETVDLNAVLQSVLDMRRRQMVTSGIRIICDLAPDLPRLQGDPYQLQQVFLNILLNAEEALAQSGHGGEIAVRTAALPEGTVLATISDNGPGIPAAIADRIFDPFFTSKSDQQNAGLGLSICYGIISAHGGRIWADSVEGQGATFAVSLPVPTGEPVPVASPPATPPISEDVHAGSRRILILEDETEIARLMSRYLERAGYHVRVVNEGQAAVEATDQEDFDLILTDLKMAGMNGKEFYAHLCTAKPWLAERVIFVTGDTVGSGTRSFLNEAGRPYLAKPFSLDELHSVIVAALQAQGLQTG